MKGKTLEMNLAKIEEEKKYDGYYSIVTSELSMSDTELRDVYRGLTPSKYRNPNSIQDLFLYEQTTT